MPRHRVYGYENPTAGRAGPEHEISRTVRLDILKPRSHGPRGILKDGPHLVQREVVKLLNLALNLGSGRDQT